MNFNDFEENVKKLDKNKFHIYRELGFDENNNFGIKKWAIFRKNMTGIEYYNIRNLSVLSSDKGNTLEDIIKFVEEQKND